MSNSNYILGNRRIEADPYDYLFQHEYGHYLQSQDAGWWYVPGFAIPSGFSALGLHPTPMECERHEARAFEQDANMRARAHFKEDDWKYDKNPIFGSGKNYEFDQNNSQYKTRSGLINTPRWATPLMIFMLLF